MQSQPQIDQPLRPPKLELQARATKPGWYYGLRCLCLSLLDRGYITRLGLFMRTVLCTRGVIFSVSSFTLVRLWRWYSTAYGPAFMACLSRPPLRAHVHLPKFFQLQTRTTRCYGLRVRRLLGAAGHLVAAMAEFGGQLVGTGGFRLLCTRAALHTMLRPGARSRRS